MHQLEPRTNDVSHSEIADLATSSALHPGDRAVERRKGGLGMLEGGAARGSELDLPGGAPHKRGAGRDLKLTQRLALR
jgi:hypothetical protein